MQRQEFGGLLGICPDGGGGLGERQNLPIRWKLRSRRRQWLRARLRLGLRRIGKEHRNTVPVQPDEHLDRSPHIPEDLISALTDRGLRVLLIQVLSGVDDPPGEVWAIRLR